MRMKKILVLSASLLLTGSLARLSAVEISQRDKDQIIANFRKAGSVPPNWEIQIKDVKESTIASLYQATMEFRSGPEVRMQNIFISTDAKQYVVGNVFKTNEDLDAVRRNQLTTQGSPSKGSANAPVTIVEFSDLECNSCKFAHEQMKADKLLDQYPGKVRFVYKNRPIPRAHPWAMSAALGTLCAYKQNHAAFWKMQDAIYVQQSSITVDNVLEKMFTIARSINLDMNRFQTCYDLKEPLSDINRDIAEAESLGVVQTPTFLVNGRVIVGYPGAQAFKLVIDEFLRKK